MGNIDSGPESVGGEFVTSPETGSELLSRPNLTFFSYPPSVAKLLDEDIKTREVLDWQGVHLLHFIASTCSQKTRIFLNLKGIDWVSHPVNLGAQQNYAPWFLGINPRGLVPVLVHDGVVHIESNDILAYLDQAFPSPRLIADETRDETLGLLREEDDLHLDLRALTMRFVVPNFLAEKKPGSLETYKRTVGTVGGVPDPRKEVELGFWRDYARHGISDEHATSAARKFRQAYGVLEARLQEQPYLLGERLSVIDIAWFIYTHRLSDAGYPFKRLHPGIHRWYLALLSRKEFSKEVRVPPPLGLITRGLHAVQIFRGSTLVRVAGL
jgi:glutathione S-transferase